MKQLLIVGFFLALASTIYFFFQLKEKEQAIQCLESNQDKSRDFLLAGRGSIGENPLSLNDSIVETHRIWSNLGNRCYVLRIEILKDGSVNSFFKQFTLQNPVTKQGKTEILVHKEQMISHADVSAFKKQLSQISIADAAINGDDIFCCFGGGNIDWEAKMNKGETYKFRTFCRKSVQFAAACEALLAKCDNVFTQH